MIDRTEAEKDIQEAFETLGYSHITSGGFRGGKNYLTEMLVQKQIKAVKEGEERKSAALRLCCEEIDRQTKKPIRMEERKMKLSGDECRILTRIAHKTKMDCWFVVLHDTAGEPYIYDLEAGKKTDMKAAIQQLAEGISDPVCYDLCFLEKSDDAILRDLLKRCEAQLPPPLGEGKKSFEKEVQKDQEALADAVAWGREEDIEKIQKRLDRNMDYLSRFYPRKKR